MTRWPVELKTADLLRGETLGPQLEDASDGLAEVVDGGLRATHSSGEIVAVAHASGSFASRWDGCVQRLRAELVKELDLLDFRSGSGVANAAQHGR
jgi:hypothetical protein